MKRCLPLLLLFCPSLAQAHARDAAGFISGFAHPFFGLDHLLAMVSVGVISARIGGRYILGIPALFVACMVLGGVLGANAVPLPMVEWGIALSVLVLGAAIAIAHRTNRMTLAVVMTFVSLFGALHGHAHGVEMPSSISPVFYSLGFVTSTSIIHLLGVYVGYLPGRVERFAKLPSYMGGAIATIGLFILFNLTGGG
jgi:urease accessory protein